jgi:uncharacterized protein DUF4398
MALGTVAALGLLAGGCSARRPPTAQLSTAEVEVRQADDAQASQYAPLELRLAREKLDRARTAMHDEDYDRARRLADEAYADAQLADAKARSAKAQKNAEEARKSIEELKGEAERPLTDR